MKLQKEDLNNIKSFIAPNYKSEWILKRVITDIENSYNTLLNKELFNIRLNCLIHNDVSLLVENSTLEIFSTKLNDSIIIKLGA